MRTLPCCVCGHQTVSLESKGSSFGCFFVIKVVQSWNSTNGLFVAITIKDFSRVEIPTSLFVDDWIDWRLPRMKLIYWCCIRQFEKGGFIWASTRVLKTQQSVKNHRYCSGITIYQLSLRSFVFSFNELCVQNKRFWYFSAINNRIKTCGKLWQKP